ncbi:MAG: formate--tetrahydrofolate ligase [Candidatus Aminicenantes bacterium]|nr:formate--tetrahydrofolate ligase [Candidatus Aminicenantes bacterium]
MAEKTPIGVQPIQEIAAKLGLTPESLEPYGKYKAKIKTRDAEPAAKGAGRLILVTAMTPTPAGEGKTTTAVGLTDALALLGRKAMVALREPSLGPVFGMKGGATGGGKAKVYPSEDINLHFNGDIHAVTTAHNLLAAMIDNRLHFEGPAGTLDGRKVTWKRAMDMNERALRSILVGLNDPNGGLGRETGFDITAASEVMAILCLSKDLADLKARLGRIVVGYAPDGKLVTAAQIKAAGAMAALLKEALKPNLVQTLEGNPAFVHGGPFANIAHGTNTVIATGLALRLADYVVTESGFATELGAEKFMDIVVRTGHVPPPAAVVIVATLRSLKYHGGVDIKALNTENISAIEKGFENLQKHVENVRFFGLPLVVALNKFPTDTEAEVKAFDELARKESFRYALSDVFGQGGRGGLELAKQVIEAAETDPADFKFLYPLEAPLADKIETIAGKVYGAARVSIEPKARKKLQRFEADGFAAVPVCIAKTQYSLSDNAKLLNRPRDFAITVTDASLSAGAGFVVALCGEIMTMPGLPKAPAAEKIDISDDGEITGIMG